MYQQGSAMFLLTGKPEPYGLIYVPSDICVFEFQISGFLNAGGGDGDGRTLRSQPDASPKATSD